MSRKWFAGLVLFFAPLTYGYDGGYNDAELHFVDFFQQTEGIKFLIYNMDKSNIEFAFLMGLPVIKKWSDDNPEAPRYMQGDDSPVYYYSRTDELLYRALKTSPHRDRFFPFMTGFNPTDMFAAKQIEQMIENDPGFWKGIGEVLTRHDSLSALTLGEQARANHPALMKVYKVAAKHKLPVILHSNITSEREKKPLYKHELVEALEKNPKTTFIWAHAGTSTTLLRRQDLSFLIDEVSQLLNDYDNLYILASWSLHDLILDTPQSKKEWVELIIKYPNRFMMGSDVVGRFNHAGDVLSGWDELLDALPYDVAEKMAKKNMLQMVK
ncbi:amidohydrolase family protein [Vibrio hepatarius]|uniref:amidohydrolase family protein n=1 Tax=Vibrio hepatarius TaxID=171383 RepID=UPI001C09A972|nr:amidohydrolase family protein [Vibrio hepatarius]MBU2897546.1 amidohydrolase family protein [Vibrio hepatarius]